MKLNPKNFTKKQWIIAIAALVLVLAIIGGLLWFFLFSDPGKNVIVKKRRKIIVPAPETSDVSDPSEDPGGDGAGDGADSFLVNILYKVRNTLFDLFGDEESGTAYLNESYAVKTLYAKDYGVKGDGVTDDGPAVAKAIAAIMDCGPGSRLVFESNKTYLINDMPTASIYLQGVRGLTVDGGNSTFLLQNKRQYVSLSGTKDCTVENFHFDHAVKSAFTAAYVRTDGNGILMRADRDIGLADGENYGSPIAGWFGVINKHDSRYHMYVASYTMVSRSERTFYIKFTEDANTNNWAANGLLEQYGMICPMPGTGHTSERGFTIDGNDSCTLSAVKIHDCSRFGMYIGSNTGKLTFRAVDFVPAENDLDKGMNFTSWRDAFHVKDNTASIHWENCVATGNYDDVFNISCTTCYLKEYNLAKNRLNVVRNDTRSTYVTIVPGDTVNLVDTTTGEDLGSATVTRVIKQQGVDNIIVLDRSLERLNETGESILVFFTSRCAPGSTITGCNFNGTFRFRGPLTVTDTKFYNMRTWIDLYGSIEGPVPKNIIFRNCEITKAGGASIILGADSGNTEKNAYHIENIRFENCTLDSTMLKPYASDEAYVILRDCKEPDGTAIPDRN